MSPLRPLGFFAFTLLLQIAVSAEGQWGHLRGRFVFDGDPPPAMPLRVDKDEAAFGEPIKDESLVVNEKNRGVANVVVYLLPKKDGKLYIHPSYARTANDKVKLAMRGGRFVPHVLLMRTTQTIVPSNKDAVGHHARIDFFQNHPMGPAIPTSDSVELRYTKEEPLPAPVACSIHPWMRGFVLLRSNPYMAKSDPNGRFEIKNLPVGEHTFRIWHERAGYVRNVRIGPHTTDAKGRLTVTISEGINELKDARLAPKLFDTDG